MKQFGPDIVDGGSASGILKMREKKRKEETKKLEQTMETEEKNHNKMMRKEEKCEHKNHPDYEGVVTESDDMMSSSTPDDYIAVLETSAEERHEIKDE